MNTSTKTSARVFWVALSAFAYLTITDSNMSVAWKALGVTLAVLCGVAYVAGPEYRRTGRR